MKKPDPNLREVFVMRARAREVLNQIKGALKGSRKLIKGPHHKAGEIPIIYSESATAYTKDVREADELGRRILGALAENQRVSESDLKQLSAYLNHERTKDIQYFADDAEPYRFEYVYPATKFAQLLLD